MCGSFLRSGMQLCFYTRFGGKRNGWYTTMLLNRGRSYITPYYSLHTLYATIELHIDNMQTEYSGVGGGMPLSSRDYYLTVALGAVRSVEMEVMNFFNSLSLVGYKKVRDVLQHDTDVTIVRKNIGQTAMPHYMEDFDNVIYPRLKNTVAKWKTHCIPFGTAALVTERTVLEQWTEESIQNLSFIAIRAMQVAEKNPKNFQYDSTYMDKSFNDYFPNIHAWQLLHER
jgi:hypothetical protein